MINKALVVLGRFEAIVQTFYLCSNRYSEDAIAHWNHVLVYGSVSLSHSATW